LSVKRLLTLFALLFLLVLVIVPILGIVWWGLREVALLTWGDKATDMALESSLCCFSGFTLALQRPSPYCAAA